MQKSRYFLALFLLVLCMAIVSFVIPASCDEASPVVGIVMPPNGATISGSQVEITAGFSSDAEHPVAKLRVFLDGQTVTERIFDSPSVSGNSSFRWDTTRTPNGKHQIDIQAFSSDGDYLGMATSVVMVLNKPVDNVAPKVGITNPKEGEIVSGVKTISITASDDSGIDPLVSIFVDDSFKSVSNTKPYTYEWDTTKQENGPHIISVKATDEAENQGSTKPVKVIVRNAASPTVNAQSASSPVVSITIADASKVSSTATPVDNTVKPNESARVTAPQTSSASVGTVAVKPAVKPTATVNATAAVPATTQVTSPKPVTVSVQAPKPVQTVSQPKVVAKVDAVKTKPATATVQAATISVPKVTVKVAPKPVAATAVTPKPDATTVAVTVPKPIPATVASTTPKPASTTVAVAAPKPAASTVVASTPKPVVIKEPVVAKTTPVMQQKPVQVTKPVVIVKVTQPAKVAKVIKPNVVMVKAPVETVATVSAVQTSVPGDKSYTMHKGESISQIAHVFGVSEKSIIALNNIERASTVKVGSKIVLPANAKMVRMRTVVENVGGTIEWNAKSKTARAICAQSEIKVKIGSRNATINDEKVKMERKANILSGRTIVPKSVMAETLSR